MARRRNESQVDEQSDNAIEALAKGTGFQLGVKSKVLPSRKQVRTPIEILNILLGGGLPFGTVAQSYGPPKVGKSTWLYQMMGIFQKQYPNGVSVIIDNEASADNERISFLGVDTNRVLRLPASSIESGFIALLKMLENKANSDQLKDVPVFVIWDTISKGLAQDSSVQSRMNAQDRARIIKNYMSPVIAQIEKQDFILGLLNQVIYTSDSYGNKKMDSGGGVALKHDVHFSTRLTPAGDVWQGNFLVRRSTRLDIDKSKIGPEIGNIPILLDIREGGVIDEIASFVEYFLWGGFINQTSGWYKIKELLEANKLNPFYKIFADHDISYRYNDLIETVRDTPELYHALRLYFIDYLSGMYKLQAKVMHEYRDECVKTLREYYDPADYYLMDNPDLRQEMIDYLQLNVEVLDAVESNLVNPDCKAICLDCGRVHDDFYPSCECEHGYHIVSRSTAELIISEIHSIPDKAEDSSAVDHPDEL